MYENKEEERIKKKWNEHKIVFFCLSYVMKRENLIPTNQNENQNENCCCLSIKKLLLMNILSRKYWFDFVWANGNVTEN